MSVAAHIFLEKLVLSISEKDHPGAQALVC